MQKGVIIHIINSLGRAGAEVLLSNTIPLLSTYKHVLITLNHPHDQLDQLEPHLITHYCLSVNDKTDWPRAVVSIRKIIHRHKPRLVHAHLQIAGLLTKMACPRRVPLFYTLHNEYSVDAFKPNRLALVAERLTARRYHHLIGVSKLVIDDYKACVPNSGSADVLYNMVYNEFFEAPSPMPYQPGSPLRCVAVGFLKPQKNYPYILDAFELLKDLPISLDVFGAGARLEEFRVLVKKRQLNRIHFRGKSEEITAELPRYHLFVMASTHEGFGIAPLEAMAIGLPAVLSNIPIFHEVAGDTVLYFDLPNPHALAHMLQDIYTGQIDLTKYSMKGRVQAAQISKQESYISNLEALYSKYCN